MKKLHFEAEYLSTPLFDHSIESLGAVAPEDLPISQDLRNEINHWNQEFQDTFCDAYPPDSGFSTSDAELNFKRRGAILAERLRIELDGKFQIDSCYITELD